MCGRFTLKTPAKEIARVFNMPDIDGIVPRYNVAPTQQVLIMRQREGEPTSWNNVRWGLIPSWSAEMPSGAPLINARDAWKDPSGTWIKSCALITTLPNPHVAKVHDRMPVILDAANFDEWLDPANQDVKSLERLLVATPEDAIDFHMVSRTVNYVKNETPECVVPMAADAAIG